MENPFELIDARLQRVESLLEQLIEHSDSNRKNSNFQVMNVEQVSAYLNLVVTSIYGKTFRRTILFYKRSKRV